MAASQLALSRWRDGWYLTRLRAFAATLGGEAQRPRIKVKS